MVTQLQTLMVTQNSILTTATKKYNSNKISNHTDRTFKTAKRYENQQSSVVAAECIQTAVLTGSRDKITTRRPNAQQPCHKQFSQTSTGIPGRSQPQDSITGQHTVTGQPPQHDTDQFPMRTQTGSGRHDLRLAFGCSCPGHHNYSERTGCNPGTGGG